MLIPVACRLLGGNPFKPSVHYSIYIIVHIHRHKLKELHIDSFTYPTVLGKHEIIPFDC